MKRQHTFTVTLFSLVLIFLSAFTVFAEEENPVWEYLQEIASVNVNSNTYELRKAPATIVANHFARLVKTDAQGNEIVLYDLTSAQLVRNILTIIVMVLAFTVIPLIFVRAFVKSAQERRAHFPASEPKKLNPIGKKQKALKWSVFGLFVLKIALTVVTFVTQRDIPSLLSVFNFFFLTVCAALNKGSALLIILFYIAMILLASLGVGLILLLAMRRNPKPAAVILSAVLIADIVCLCISIFSGVVEILNLLPLTLIAIAFNLGIMALIIFYTREARKETHHETPPSNEL